MKVFVKKILLCFVLFNSLCIGLIPLFGLPSFVSILSEISIYILLIVSLVFHERRTFPWPHLAFCLLSMLLIALCSMALNETQIHRAVFSFRLLYRFYVLYLAIIYLDLDDEDFKFINRFIVVLLLINIPVVGIKLFKQGVRETTSGLYTTGDGSLTTYIPLFVVF